jgi:hypothetical protein
MEFVLERPLVRVDERPAVQASGTPPVHCRVIRGECGRRTGKLRTSATCWVISAESHAAGGGGRKSRGVVSSRGTQLVPVTLLGFVPVHMHFPSGTEPVQPEPDPSNRARSITRLPPSGPTPCRPGNHSDTAGEHVLCTRLRQSNTDASAGIW